MHFAIDWTRRIDFDLLRAERTKSLNDYIKKFELDALLCFKAESAGCKVIKVSPINTSKKCSSCGKIKNINLFEREYVCTCGLSLDRDVNAACNILQLALGQGNAEKNSSFSMKQKAISVI